MRTQHEGELQRRQLVYPKALVSVGRGLKRTSGDIEKSVLAELTGHVGTRGICTELPKQGYIEGSSGY